MTTRIGLLTTGVCEHRSLAASLQRVFAAADVVFESLMRQPIDSVTSRHLTYPAPVSSVPTQIDKLVAAMVAELEKRDAPDFVIAIDDLELPNVATPENVTRLVHDAAMRGLGAVPTHRQTERVRARASFHMLSPMLEAYFFGERAAIERAGALLPAIVDPGGHVEAFRSVDVAYILAPDERHHPWRSADRVQHPKRYLRFLAEPDGYKETRGGSRALETLDWASIFASAPPYIAFARSLFEDLADAIGITNPFPGAPHPLTARRVDGVLRNL